MFCAGRFSGHWLSMLVSHGFDVRLVAASTWKWVLKLARRGQVRDKNASRELATKWFANTHNQVAASIKRGRTTVGLKPCSSSRTVTGHRRDTVC